jgi:hypothetical protein
MIVRPDVDFILTQAPIIFQAEEADKKDHAIRMAR